MKVYKIPQLQVFLIFYIMFQWLEGAKFKSIHYNYRHSPKVWESNLLNIIKFSDFYSYRNTQKKTQTVVQKHSKVKATKSVKMKR